MLTPLFTFSGSFLKIHTKRKGSIYWTFLKNFTRKSPLYSSIQIGGKWFRTQAHCAGQNFRMAPALGSPWVFLQCIYRLLPLRMGGTSECFGLLFLKLGY